MRFHRVMAAAALASALLASAGADAFETTSVGGTSAAGSAKYQEPDEMSAAAMPSASSPFGNFNFSAGSGANSDSDNASTKWLSSTGSPGFGFTGSESSSAAPASPFNTPILRERN